MNWTPLLMSQIENAYSATAKLMDKVDAENLDWKPETGSNWMTVGQLLMHITSACGGACRAFATGDWGLPPGVKLEDIPPEEMLPPAEKLPTIESLEQARKLLEEDRDVAIRTIEQTGEECLQNQRMAAPWAPGKEFELGWHMLQMVQHLESHKAQLFYYLKLQGKPVNTGDLWG